MSFAISLVVIIVIVSLFGTVLVARNVEENYASLQKKCEKLICNLYSSSFCSTGWGNMVCGNDLIVCERTEMRV